MNRERGPKKRDFLSILQGHPTQTGFFETALTDRNVKVKLSLKLVLEC